MISKEDREYTQKMVEEMQNFDKSKLISIVTNSAYLTKAAVLLLARDLVHAANPDLIGTALAFDEEVNRVCNEYLDRAADLVDEDLVE